MLREGVARLDSYFDPNERRYYITPESVEQAIAEEKAKADKTPASEPFGSVRKEAERAEPSFPHDPESREITELENKIQDLEITNRAKDYFIGRLEKERDGFFEQLLTANRKMGELENKLLQIESPAKN
jgi:predicted RNase H-like nuclease (RuvC/YqgF family)